MKSKKIFWTVTMGILAIVILFFIVNMIFSNYDLNEGKFRVSDALISSTAYFEDKSEINKTWSYDVSQINNLVLLISAPKDTIVTKSYISDFKTTLSSVTINEQGKETKLESGLGKSLDLESNFDENGNLKLSIIIYNENILKDFKVEDYTKSLKKDGTVFSLAGKTLQDIKFKTSFNINIVDKTGRKSVLKLDLDLPNENFFYNGTFIEKLDVSNLNFKI